LAEEEAASAAVSVTVAAKATPVVERSAVERKALRVEGAGLAWSSTLRLCCPGERPGARHVQ